MSQRGITRCRVGQTSHTESKGDLAPASSATLREAASGPHEQDADAGVVDKYHDADEHAVELPFHHNPAVAAVAHSTVARAGAGAGKTGWAVPPAEVNGLHCLSG